VAGGSFEERIAKVEGILEEMSRRINHLESDIANLRGDVNSLRGEVNSLFRWTVGLILGMWITIQATLIPILLRILGAI
jgi:hypothetical protein